MGQSPVTCCSEPCSAQPVQKIHPVTVAECVNRRGKQNFAAMRSINRADTFDSTLAEQEELVPLPRVSERRLSQTSWQQALLTPVMPSLLPQSKHYASRFMGGNEASSDLSNLMAPAQTYHLTRATGDSLQPSAADMSHPLQPSWPQVPTATGVAARTQPSFTEIPALACANHSTTLPPCQHIVDMAVLDNATNPESDEEPKRERSALTQWYEGASESHSVSLHDVPESHGVSLGDVNYSFTCDADADCCIRREAKSLTCWYEDVLSNASTLGTFSEIGDSDEGSCITHSSCSEGLEQQTRAETSDRFSQDCESQTMMGKTHKFISKRTNQVLSHRPTSIETEVFFLFDPSATEDN